MKMRWFEGSIAEAVNVSKQKNSVFVVYVEGNDEMSMKLRRFIDEEKIREKLESEHFVAIKIDSGSEAYMQFAQIYQLVPLPSIFFIGKNGAPIQVVTGVISSADELEQKLKIVLETVGVKAFSSPGKSLDQPSSSQSSFSSASADFIATEQTTADANYEVVCEGDVCYKRPKTGATATTSPSASKVDDTSTESKSSPSTTSSTSDSTQDVKIEAPPAKPAAQTDTISVNAPPTPPTTPTATAAVSSPAAVTPSAPPAGDSAISVPAEDIAARVEQAKKLIEEKRKQKEEEEKRLEREREIRRRKEGQEMINFKKTQREQELQQLKENIRREKLEEQATRQRILEQIASDRAEQAKKFTTPEKQNTAPAEAVQQSPAVASTSNSSEFSRIQFRKPDGDAKTQTFKSSDHFQVVRDYVRNTLLAESPIKEFSLATTFPRREFTAADDATTLLDLGLCPSAVILVIAGQRAAHSPAAIVARSGGVVNVFNTLFWGLLSPFCALFGYLKGWIVGRRPDTADPRSGAQKRANEDVVADNDAAKRRNIDRLLNRNFINDDPKASTSDPSKKDGAAYRRVGGGSNVHRLRETKDSDDENNTWNGNSTQQQ